LSGNEHDDDLVSPQAAFWDPTTIPAEDPIPPKIKLNILMATTPHRLLHLASLLRRSDRQASSTLFTFTSQTGVALSRIGSRASSFFASEDPPPLSSTTTTPPEFAKRYLLNATGSVHSLPLHPHVLIILPLTCSYVYLTLYLCFTYAYFVVLTLYLRCTYAYFVVLTLYLRVLTLYCTPK
jgi:hypothetical protein